MFYCIFIYKGKYQCLKKSHFFPKRHYKCPVGNTAPKIEHILSFFPFAGGTIPTAGTSGPSCAWETLFLSEWSQAHNNASFYCIYGVSFAVFFSWPRKSKMNICLNIRQSNVLRRQTFISKVSTAQLVEDWELLGTQFCFLEDRALSAIPKPIQETRPRDSACAAGTPDRGIDIIFVRSRSHGGTTLSRSPRDATKACSRTGVGMTNKNRLSSTTCGEELQKIGKDWQSFKGLCQKDPKKSPI